MTTNTTAPAAADVIKAMRLTQEQDESNEAGRISARNHRISTFGYTALICAVRGGATKLAKAIAAEQAAGTPLPADQLAYTTDQMIGYAAVVGVMLNLPEDENGNGLPDDINVKGLPMVIKRASSVKPLKALRIAISACPDIPTAWALVSKLNEQALASKGETTDVKQLTAASGPIGKALTCEATTEGAALALAIIESLTARYFPKPTEQDDTQQDDTEITITVMDESGPVAIAA